MPRADASRTLPFGLAVRTPSLLTLLVFLGLASPGSVRAAESSGDLRLFLSLLARDSAAPDRAFWFGWFAAFPETELVK